MIPRSLLAVIGLVEFLAPRSFARFWLNRCCADPERVELRRWVPLAIRLEGLALLGWVVWSSREDLAGLPEAADPAGWIREEEVVPDVEAEEMPSLQPGTTRFDLAAALYQSDDPLAVSDLVERSAGTDWEVGRSSASATLYRMHSDGVVERREREEGRGFEYWLSASGRQLLEDADTAIEPGTTPVAD